MTSIVFLTLTILAAGVGLGSALLAPRPELKPIRVKQEQKPKTHLGKRLR